MNNNKSQSIHVYADWVGLAFPTSVGILNSSLVRGKEIFSFEYDLEWLANNQSQAIDPALQLFRGQWHAPIGQNNFGIFLDSSPDRWGRFLMKRREAQLAREQKREPRKLIESDYLLGVYDEHRMGGLRFRTSPNGSFLDNNKELASPPWTSLRELEQACLTVEKDDSEKNPNYLKWLKMLIAPGGSLGGARPKAGVVDDKQHLWIAKFPSNNDEYDIGVWEMLAYQLAIRVGIVMAPAKIEKFNSKHHTFLGKRFDRTPDGRRIHFASAMTLLQRVDGDDASKGASYLELAEFILRNGARPNEDLEQLWRRIVFYACISNVDDHLRNHGFLLQPNGWVLSPAFDVNPVATGDGLKLNISEFDNSQDLKLVKEVSSYFRVEKSVADEIINEIVSTVSNWQKIATKMRISSYEQGQMASAFRICEK